MCGGNHGEVGGQIKGVISLYHVGPRMTQIFRYLYLLGHHAGSLLCF